MASVDYITSEKDIAYKSAEATLLVLQQTKTRLIKAPTHKEAIFSIHNFGTTQQLAYSGFPA